MNFPFSVHKHLIMACHITGVYDVNRNNILQDDDYSLVKDWAESVAALQLYGVIFHNNFSEETCAKYHNEYITFIKIAYSTQFNPNIYRYFVYRDFLRLHYKEIDSLFITDISDVTMVNNPFIQPLFLANSSTIFCGDEPKLLDNEWMVAHSEHLRSKITDYATYEENFSTETLLNCGIIGGNIEVMQMFIEKICLIHQQHNHDNQTAYTGDMGAFNYLVRTQFNNRLLHGAPINTDFKSYQYERNDCWFRHK